MRSKLRWEGINLEVIAMQIKTFYLETYGPSVLFILILIISKCSFLYQMDGAQVALIAHIH